MTLIRRILLSFTALTLVCALDGHLFVMQVAAWTKMTYINAHGHSLRDAATRALDGKHPCQICKSIGKASRGQGIALVKVASQIKSLRLVAGLDKMYLNSLANNFATFKIQFPMPVHLAPPRPPPRLS